MVEIHIPKTWSYNASVGVWDTATASNVGSHNQLYLSNFRGRTPLKFDVDSALFRIRCFKSLPMEVQCYRGTTYIMEPIADNIVGEEPVLTVINGKLVWT